MFHTVLFHDCVLFADNGGMARLISMNNIDQKSDSGSGIMHINCYDAETPDNCSVQIDWPVQSNHLVVNKESVGMKKSPSMSNFCSKRKPVNMQWKNLSLTTRKGNTKEVVFIVYRINAPLSSAK